MDDFCITERMTHTHISCALSLVNLLPCTFDSDLHRPVGYLAKGEIFINRNNLKFGKDPSQTVGIEMTFHRRVSRMFTIACHLDVGEILLKWGGTSI